MCRWLAYSGSPVTIEELLYKPANSLVMQSKHARMGVETMNGDGFGAVSRRVPQHGAGLA
jgi:predicted glutamine amidotransferase